MNKQTARTAIDGCMIIILPLLMSYSLIGKANHIYLGLLCSPFLSVITR